MPGSEKAGPLAGIRVLELARILAGPWAGQMLADLGADVIKVEREGAGDDTRGWGPPFVDAKRRRPSRRRLFPRRQPRQAFDRARLRERGRQAHRAKLAARSDILIENFKVGGLDEVRARLQEPVARSIRRLIYCSVTGFGQTGPYAPRAGYDLMAQGMGGFMDLTGTAGRRADPRGRAGVRHLHRHLFSRRHPGRAATARAHRQGLLCGHRAGRHDRRRARQPGAELSRVGQGAQAASATPIPTSCPIRCSRSPTATSSSPPATTASISKLCRRARRAGTWQATRPTSTTSRAARQREPS